MLDSYQCINVKKNGKENRMRNTQLLTLKYKLRAVVRYLDSIHKPLDSDK